MKTLYLGTHMPNWLHVGDGSVPLFVSHRRLHSMCQLPRARGRWALDSGGFSELDLYGGWRTTPSEYIDAIYRYDLRIGTPDWAAPQDWMCEPPILAKTGLTVADHQALTVASFLALERLWDEKLGAASRMFIPVLQGWKPTDYLDCIDRYHQAGVDLATEPLVGLGSVCRRQATSEISDIVTAITEAVPGIKLHGFGVKTLGLRRVGHLLETADTMSWSKEARHGVRLPDCYTHLKCNNCREYALGWRDHLLNSIPTQRTRELEEATR